MQDSKTMFLLDNPQLKEIQDSKAPVQGDFHSITDDDEVWIVQCPKHLDLTALTNQKIKLPGKSSHKNLEILTQEFPVARTTSFGYRHKKWNEVKVIDIRGSLVVREKLKAIKKEYHLSEGQQRVPVPTGLTERHPLLGVDFKEKLTINPTIQKRLEESKSIKTTKKVRKAKNVHVIKIESDEDEVEFVAEHTESKKSKKSKRKHEDAETVRSSKKSKKSKNGDDLSLQWIKNI